MEKPAAIQFPATPEHPGLNAELQYRLQLLRVLDQTVGMTEDAQQSLATSAWKKAMSWGHEWLLKGACESIDQLGPLSGAAQRSELKDFIESLDANDPLHGGQAPEAA
jgi:hypothetical protein